jgi:hypothetical protein
MNAAVREFGFSFPSEVAAWFTCVAMTAGGLMSSFTACAVEAGSQTKTSKYGRISDSVFSLE